MRCEGCGTEMIAASADSGDAKDQKWTCPRCASWCLTDDGEVYMAAWLLEGREWPK